MKTNIITLNEREITFLQVGLLDSQEKVREKIEHLKEHNASGINTKIIISLTTQIQEIDILWDKLHTALTFMNQ